MQLLHTKRVNPMNEKEIKKTARKLKWRTKDAKVALDEYFNTESRLDKYALFRVSLHARNPDERLNLITKEIIKHYNGDVVDLVCNLLMTNDPCFNMLALFNIYYMYSGSERINIPNSEDSREDKIDIVKFNKKHSSVSWRLNFTRNYKSFIYWDSSASYKEMEYYSNPKFLLNSIEEHIVTTQNDISHDPEKLKHKFLDLYIQYLQNSNQLSTLFTESTTVFDDLKPLMRQVLKRVGYLAFNLEVFRKQINFFCKLPDLKESREFLEDITEILSPSAKTKISHTRRKYWLWYVLINKLQEGGYGVRASFRKAVETLGESTEKGISKRYYDRQKIARKEELSIEKIISDKYLGLELNELLIKAGVIKDEFLYD